MTQQKINHTVLAKTLKLLQAGQPVSAKTVAEIVSIHLLTAQRWMRELVKEKVVYVCGWLPDSLGRDAVPLYALGDKEAAPRKKQTRSEIMHRYRERHAKPQPQSDAF
jgi:predicted ArsR family transcriptional regulator